MAAPVGGTRHHRRSWETPSARATGCPAPAAALMPFRGVTAIFHGIAAIANDAVFVVTDNLRYAFNLTGWGWEHLILGALVMLAGISLLRGATWARMVGVALAGLSMIANFVWLPHAPVWSIVLI